MIRFIGQRLAQSFVILFGVVSTVFALFMLIPGDPARLALGQKGDEATLAAMRKDMGLDKSKLQQYFLYLNDLSPIGTVASQDSIQTKLKLLQVNKEKTLALKLPWLRISYQSGRPVSSSLTQAFVNTIILATAAFGISTIFGVLFGVLSALYRNKWQDAVIMSIANVGISVPSFFAAIVIAWVFGFLLHSITGLPMYGSLYDIHPFKGSYIAWHHLILPAIALGIRPLSVITQLTRSSMIDVLHQDYIRTARAKGLTPRLIYYRHALLNALNPVLTSVSGWFASLLSGAFFIEFIFGWNGLGKLTVDALLTSDLPLIMGAVLSIAIIFVFINIIVDVLYAWIDPRIRNY
ncbi:MAG: ABC transporter permease [Bacteroidota bacterium]|nr:ABC transporter permease [Bacteroidota bacterium]